MDLNTYLIEAGRGAASALAQKIGVHPVMVSQWSAEKNPKPVAFERCAEIEQATEGAVACEELRPDLQWGRVADPNWPWHPKGRPVLEIAKVAA